MFWIAPSCSVYSSFIFRPCVKWNNIARDFKLGATPVYQSKFEGLPVKNREVRGKKGCCSHDVTGDLACSFTTFWCLFSMDFRGFVMKVRIYITRASHSCRETSFYHSARAKNCVFQHSYNYLTILTLYVTRSLYLLTN